MTSTTSAGHGRRELVGKGSIYTLATALQLLGVVVVLPLLSRLLSTDQFGQVALAVVVTNLLGLLASLGLPAVITREYFQGDDGPAAARVLAAVTLLVSVGVVALFAALGPLWAAPLGGYRTALVLGTATSASWAGIITAQAILRASGSARRFVILAVVNVIGGQLAGVSLVLIAKPSAAWYLFGVLTGSVAAALVGVVWTRPSLAGWSRLARPRRWFAIALPTVPHTAALFLMATGDRFIVDIQRGDSAVASYSLAYQVGALGITVIAAANNAWAPLIYGADDDRRWGLLADTTRDMVSIAAVMAGLLAATAPISLWILADPSRYDIADLAPVVAITALAAVPYTLYLASAHALFWAGATTPLLWITPSAVALNLAAKAYVLPRWGFVGAAVVTVAAYCLLALLVGAARRRLANVQWRGRALAGVGAAVVCATVAIVPLSPLGTAARIAAVIACCVALVPIARELKALKRS